MNRKLIPLIAFLILSAGCKVTFVPDYDATIEQQITDAAKANDKIYIELLAADSSKRDYATYEQEYIAVEADINSIELKNEARKNNSDMLDLIKNHLHPSFTKFQSQHKNATVAKPYTQTDIGNNQSNMQREWKALLLAEKGLPQTTNTNH